MKRILQISINIALLSLIPVLTWFVLGIIIDERLINVFTIIYPIQFIWYIFKSIFSTVPNIVKEKHGNDKVIFSSLLSGIILSSIFFLILILNIEHYISFMNMDIDFYKLFVIYGLIQLFIQLIFEFVINNLYYKDKISLSNKYSYIFNTLNFISITLMAIIYGNSIVTIVIPIIIISLFTLYILIKEIKVSKISFEFFKFIKYDALELISSVSCFLIYLTAFTITFSFGEEYALALAFVTLITDAQWDIFNAISIVAKIDISKNKFVYKEHRNNGLKLLLILIISIILMIFSLIWFYKLNIWIFIIFLSVDLISMFMGLFYEIKMTYIQINEEDSFVVKNTIVAYVIRFTLSLLNNPFCSYIGLFFSSLYQFIFSHFYYKKLLKRKS